MSRWIRKQNNGMKKNMSHTYLVNIEVKAHQLHLFHIALDRKGCLDERLLCTYTLVHRLCFGDEYVWSVVDQLPFARVALDRE